MKYLDLLRASAREAITNKVSWLYILVALAGQITALSSPLTKVIPSIKFVSSEIWFVSTVLSLIFVSALVYSVSQKELHKLASSVLDSWRKGWSKIIQVGLLNILFLVVLFVLLALVGVLLKKLIPYGVLGTFILAPFLRPILNFGICAIIISNASVVAAVRTSISMFIRNILQTLIISGILILIQRVLLDIIVLIFMRQYGYVLFTSPFKSLEIPQVMFWDQVLALLMSPWIVIVFTHLYLSFMNASESTALSTSQEAA
jgi:hypothetical protein